MASSTTGRDPPIRLYARPEVLPGGEAADPVVEPPTDTVARVRSVSEAWARWVEADQAAELAADPAFIAEVAAFAGAEQYAGHYARIEGDRVAAGVRDCEPLALDAVLLAVDLRGEVAHTLSWRRGGSTLCRSAASPDVWRGNAAYCPGELRLRYHAWALIEGEWLMTGVVSAGGRHADDMRPFTTGQPSTVNELMWRAGHYLDRIEAEYDASGRPCD